MQTVLLEHDTAITDGKQHRVQREGAAIWVHFVFKVAK